MMMIYEGAPELEMGHILRQCRQDYQLGEALGNPLPQPGRVKIWLGERELNERLILDTYDNRDNEYNEKYRNHPTQSFWPV